MILRRMMGPSLETGAVFDAALSGNYCRIADCVSVSAVQEKCDEKGLEAALGHRSVGCRAVWQGPFSTREKGRTPGNSLPDPRSWPSKRWQPSAYNANAGRSDYDTLGTGHRLRGLPAARTR
jgi:hypothetical protein